MCTWFSLAFAQDRVESTDTTNRLLQQVEVQGFRTPSNIAGTQPSQRLERSDMENLGYSSVADAVRRFAGTNVRDYGGLGGMKTVSVRNLGAHHTAVSYDGITISNTQAGQIDIGRFSLDNVASLTFTIGSDDNIMLSARHRASAGILNIETERPDMDGEKDYALRLRVRGGSFGQIMPSFRYSQRLGSNTCASVEGSYQHGDGNYPFLLVNGINKTHEKRINSDIDAWAGEANLYHTFADHSKISAKASWFYSNRGLPGAVILYNPISRERLWDEDFFAQTLYQRQLSERWQLEARLKYSHSWNRYVDTDVKYQNGRQVDTNRQNEYYASATVGWSPLEYFQVSLAEDVSVNTLRTNVNIEPNPVRFTSLTALTACFNPERFKLIGTLLGTYSSEHLASGNSPEDRRRLSPTISASYQLLENHALYVRAMMKSTFRMPTFNDLYYLRFGNTGLRPERAQEWNVGLTWNQPLFGRKGFLALTADAYYNNVRDKIVAFPSTYVWKMANFGKVNIKGIDFTLAGEAPLSQNMSLHLTAAYTIQKAIDITEPGSQYYKNQLPYTPRHFGNGSLLLHTPWVNLGYSIVACGQRYSMGLNLPQYQIHSYQEHTITASREFHISHCLLRLQATLQNLTNEQYEIIKYYPMPGRTWMVSATVEI